MRARGSDRPVVWLVGPGGDEDLTELPFSARRERLALTISRNSKEMPARINRSPRVSVQPAPDGRVADITAVPSAVSRAMTL